MTAAVPAHDAHRQAPILYHETGFSVRVNTHVL
jgi:hypothetical protein